MVELSSSELYDLTGLRGDFTLGPNFKVCSP